MRGDKFACSWMGTFVVRARQCRISEMQKFFNFERWPLFVDFRIEQFEFMLRDIWTTIINWIIFNMNEILNCTRRRFGHNGWSLGLMKGWCACASVSLPSLSAIHLYHLCRAQLIISQTKLILDDNAKEGLATRQKRVRHQYENTSVNAEWIPIEYGVCGAWGFSPLFSCCFTDPTFNYFLLIFHVALFCDSAKFCMCRNAI